MAGLCWGAMGGAEGCCLIGAYAACEVEARLGVDGSIECRGLRDERCDASARAVLHRSLGVGGALLDPQAQQLAGLRALLEFGVMSADGLTTRIRGEPEVSLRLGSRGV